MGEAESWGNRGVASMSSTSTLIDKLRRDAGEVQLFCLGGNTPLGNIYTSDAMSKLPGSILPYMMDLENNTGTSPPAVCHLNHQDGIVSSASF